MTRLLAAAGLALLAAGCGDDGPAFGEVEGVVRVRGRPLAGVEVAFLPDPARNPGDGRRSSAVTDADGRYRLACDLSGRPGAMVGFHRVCVYDITAWANAEAPGAGKAADEFDSPRREVPAVPAAYSSPANTPLRDVEVRAGPQTIDLDLSAKPN